MLQVSKMAAVHFYIRFFIVVGFCYCTMPVQAQLCSGSLGDPVVNITFGAGGGNTGYTPTSGYTYTSSTCPNDGYYTIANNTANCFSGSWHTVQNDHTGSGAFMLVNASYTPGDFFLATVNDLCPNTTYEFAAWIMNVLVQRNGIKPNITFSIETPTGTVLQTYATGDLAETAQPTWKQYGFYFSTPVNNPVIVLRMTNNAPGGIGNDLALDDITFRPCGKAVISAAIQGNNDTVHVCDDNTNAYTFNGTVSAGYSLPVFQWQVSTDSGKKWTDIIGANALQYRRSPAAVGVYWYRLTVTEQTGATIPSCRIASNSVVIQVHAKPQVNAGPDRIVFLGDSAVLMAAVTGEDPVYYWDPPDHLNAATLLNPLASPPASLQYTLYATSVFGCKNENQVFVKVVGGIYVPTAFTPNNDGTNDHWRIPFLDPLLGADVRVYNRYGQLVYRSKAQTVDWDGSTYGMMQPGGAYVYYISFKKNSGIVTMKGTLLLIK